MLPDFTTFLVQQQNLKTVFGANSETAVGGKNNFRQD
jgi:hypothetical protein